MDRLQDIQGRELRAAPSRDVPDREGWVDLERIVRRKPSRRRGAAAGRPLSFQNRRMPNLVPRHLVRAADADLLDTFLVSAIATVVVIRIFLEATGYPQLGGGGLHIAHVLW